MIRYFKKNWHVFVLCFLITLIFSLPLFDSGIVNGHDLLFHLNRIQSLSEAISHGDFFPSIFHNQSYGFGYGTPLFYSNLFVYIPALLVNMGLTLTLSYKIFLFICAMLTALSMYYCIYLIFKNKKISYASVVLYMFSAFHITDVYVRSAIGEILAFIFVPLVFLSIYQMLVQKKDCWLLMGLSFTGLLLSHNISFLISCGVFAIFLIAMFKQVDKKTFKTVMYAIILSFLLSAFYLLPMLEQMRGGLYAVNGYFNKDSLLHSTLNIEQIFKINTTFGYLGHTYDLSQAATMNIGLVLSIMTPLYLFCKKKTLFFTLTFVVCYLAIWMTTSYFPWDLFGILGFMQFSWRVLIVALPAAVTVVSYILNYFEDENKFKFIYWIVMFFSLSIGIYQLAPIYNEEKILKDKIVFSTSEYNHIGELSLGDYLPLNSNINYQEYGQYIETNNQLSNIENYNKSYNNMSFTISEAKENDFYTLPLIYYKGYIVEIQSNSENVITQTYPNEEGLVTFRIPNNRQEISIKISYKGTKIQKLSSILSVLSFIMIIVYFILRKGRKIK